MRKYKCSLLKASQYKSTSNTKLYQILFFSWKTSSIYSFRFLYFFNTHFWNANLNQNIKCFFRVSFITCDRYKSLSWSSFFNELSTRIKSAVSHKILSFSCQCSWLYFFGLSHELIIHQFFVSVGAIDIIDNLIVSSWKNKWLQFAWNNSLIFNCNYSIFNFTRIFINNSNHVKFRLK